MQERSIVVHATHFIYVVVNNNNSKEVKQRLISVTD
jgi:hypothetical protein